MEPYRPKLNSPDIFLCQHQTLNVIKIQEMFPKLNMRSEIRFVAFIVVKIKSRSSGL